MKQILLNDLKDELTGIKRTSKSVLEQANRSIIISRNVLKTLKKEIILNGFVSVQEEINFFKYTKQIPLKELIYFSKLRSFEMQFPKGDKDSQRKTIKRKINKLNRFFLRNIDFGQYIELGCTHFDEHYFTRKSNENLPFTLSKFYYQDTEFSTLKDMLLAEFKAYGALVGYLEERLFTIENSLNGFSLNLKASKKLHWPFGNTAFVEILSALCAAGLHNHNNISIIEVARKLQEIFDVEPKDIYNIRKEITNRKNSRTLFLDLLTDAFLSEMDKKEE